ncbi:hypothetical protein B0H34DRAFT_792399 [Crassisporium funariophilum]|nr:hypothetical protein B0H34DRAFT_792399 [Crassisporium funariophilum]
MVSLLWKASSDGDLQKVFELLSEASAVDVELKDHTGVTPLIEAVRNSHVEVVRALLDKGADPTNSSSQGRPEHYTSDPTILDLLHAAQNKTVRNEMPHPVYSHDVNEDPEKPFYAPPPPESYTYYPTINPSLSTVNEGGGYYPPQPHPAGENTAASGLGNLPPPDVARMIPCRYFPACRYGAQCMFAHPQTPYYQGPMPPVQYSPYDPMGNPYVPTYYPSPPPFPQSNGIHPLTPMSPPPGPPHMHARSPSEGIHPVQGHFSPNGVPPPLPYGPMSPPVYSHPGHVPVPMPIPPLPPLHHQVPHHHPGPQSPPNLYGSSTSPVPPFPVHQDVPVSYSSTVPPSNVNYPEVASSVKQSPENDQAENYITHPVHREAANHHRRGSIRRTSFGARKPPCLFFPAGRCKNGDGCRFPHVLTDYTGIPSNQNHSPSFPPARGGAPRPRGPVNGHNGFPNIEGKLGAMAIRDEQPRPKIPVEGSSRSHSSDAGFRPKPQQGGPKHNHAGVNGNGQPHKRFSTVKQQRVPNADEFPVLAGSTTPPNRAPGANGTLVNGNGPSGPTAAQVLQAPAPDPKPETNGIAPESSTSAPEQPIVNGVSKLPPMSFATVTSSAADVSKEVSVFA